MPELVSIHIPKTAGRSFLVILKEVYGDKKVVHFDRKNFPLKEIPEVNQFEQQIKVDTQVIHGHFTYKEAKKFPHTINSHWVTWVRDPVERVISNYGFFKKRVALSINDPELHKRKNETLMEYARLENSRNRMCKFIDGKSPHDFFFIGVMENFESEVKILASMLNWKSFYIPQENTNIEFKSTLPVVNDDERRVIEELNMEDFRLYRKVLEMREKRMT